jgi:uncharacterized protein YjiS (DUF1127 family)
MTVSYHIDEPAPRVMRMKVLSRRQMQTVAALCTSSAIWLSTKTVAIVRTFQVARLMSTLAELSDDQLEVLGITRSDIPHYARSLMAPDDGTD